MVLNLPRMVTGCGAQVMSAWAKEDALFEGYSRTELPLTGLGKIPVRAGSGAHRARDDETPHTESSAYAS